MGVVSPENSTPSNSSVRLLVPNRGELMAVRGEVGCECDVDGDGDGDLDGDVVDEIAQRKRSTA